MDKVNLYRDIIRKILTSLADFTNQHWQEPQSPQLRDCPSPRAPNLTTLEPPSAARVNATEGADGPLIAAVPGSTLLLK
jgi:hypothetical protein